VTYHNSGEDREVSKRRRLEERKSLRNNSQAIENDNEQRKRQKRSEIGHCTKTVQRREKATRGLNDQKVGVSREKRYARRKIENVRRRGRRNERRRKRRQGEVRSIKTASVSEIEITARAGQR